MRSYSQTRTSHFVRAQKWQRSIHHILTLVHLLRGELYEGAPNGPPFGESMGHQLSASLYQKYGAQPVRPGEGGLGHHRRRLILEYLHAHISSLLTLEGLASRTGLSSFHFCRTFKQEFDLPPHQFVLKLGIDQAQQLLWRSSLDHAEISRREGFSHASHLGRIFSTLYPPDTGPIPGAATFGRTNKALICAITNLLRNNSAARSPKAFPVFSRRTGSTTRFLPARHRGCRGMQAAIDRLRGVLPDLEATVIKLIASGDTVAVPLVFYRHSQRSNARGNALSLTHPFHYL